MPSIPKWIDKLIDKAANRLAARVARSIVVEQQRIAAAETERQEAELNSWNLASLYYLCMMANWPAATGKIMHDNNVPIHIVAERLRDANRRLQ